MLVLGLMILTIGGLVASQASADLAVQVIGVETGDFGNGQIDHIKVSFNVAMTTDAANVEKSSGPGDPGFEVDGYQIDRFQWLAAEGTPNTTLLIHVVEKTTPDTAARPVVTYRSGNGGASSTLGQEAEDFSGTAADKAGPVLLRFDVNDQGSANMFNSTADEAWLTFSEPASITGATPRDRWIALEKAVKFVNEPGRTGCQADGTGSAADQANNVYNFPQPRAEVPTEDVILSPATGASASVFHIKQGTARASTRFFIATPQLCYTGIDTAAGAALGIADAAGNGASPLSALQNRGVYINPVDAQLLLADTLDSNANGTLDGLTLTFNQKIEDATFADALATLSVTNGSDTATVDTVVDTGATANDQILIARFGDVSWLSGVRPTVSYVKPEGCSVTSGTPGAKAIVPTGGSWRACVASFSVTAGDKARPVVLSAATADVAGGAADGRIDRLDLTFSEDVSTPTAAGWTVDGAAATAAVDSSDARVVHLTFTAGSTPNSNALPAYAYASQAVGGGAGTVDLGANQPTVGTRVATIDASAPVVTAVSQFDGNTDGSIDRIEVTYSEPVVEPTTAAVAGFTVGGNAVTGFATPAPGDVVDDALLSLAVDPVAGTEEKSVTFTPASSAIADAAGNAADDQAVAPSLVTDLAAPVAEISVSPSAPLSVGDSTITATFSEDMATTAPTATFGGAAITAIADADHVNGWRIEDPSIWEGTVSVIESDCGNPTGCEVQIQIADATDLAPSPNTQVTAIKDTEVDTIAPQAPIITGMRTALPEGESAPANTLNMFSQNLTLDATVAADAGSGEAFIAVGDTQIGIDDSIAETATDVSPTIAFDDLADLRDTFDDGTHALGVTVCDDAQNCSTSATPVTVTVDTLSIAIEVGGPAADAIISAGSTEELTWQAGDDADFDHVELDLHEGSSTRAIDHAIVDRSGSTPWVAPAIESDDVTVTATSVDAAGNKASAGSATFIVDAQGPVVDLTALPTFLPAGKPVTVQWTATDASIDHATDPITIQYSSDNGSTWKQINGGSYSRANDGSEVWTVPTTSDFETRVRVVATDATAKISSDVSGRLARGVSGYLAQHAGKVYAYGTAIRTTNESQVGSSDWVRGLAMRSSGASGYVLSRTGRLYPFSVGSGAIPKRPKTSTFGGDDARDVVLRTDSSGYVLRDTGKLYAFGGAPKARMSKTWTCDCARSVVMLASGRGGYVLDAYGRLYPFAVGSYAMPAQIQSKALFSTKRAVDVVLKGNGRSGYLLETTGNVRAFGGAAGVGEAGDGSTKKAVALIKVTDTAGYWVDYRGKMYAWGAAFGSPSNYTFTASTIRGAAGN